MSLEAFIYTEFGLVAAYALTLAAIAIGWLPVSTERLKLAQYCFYTVAAITGAASVFWGSFSDMPWLPRNLIVGLVCAFAGIAAAQTGQFLERTNSTSVGAQNGEIPAKPPVPLPDKSEVPPMTKDVDARGGIYNEAPNFGNQTVNNFAPQPRHLTEPLKRALLENFKPGTDIEIRFAMDASDGRDFADEIARFFRDHGYGNIPVTFLWGVPNAPHGTHLQRYAKNGVPDGSGGIIWIGVNP